MRHYRWEKTGDGLADNLGAQFQKVVRGFSQGSIQTRRRYIEAGERFILFIAPKFRVQKLQNIADKHLESWANHLLSMNKSKKYIKNELSAIRFLHRQTPQTRFELAESQVFNMMVGLGSTPPGEADRAWTEDEFHKMVSLANKKGKPEYARVFKASYNLGLRLDECSPLRRDEVEAALRSGVLQLTNTKGGRPREVPLSSEAKKVLEESIQGVPRGCYVFCPEGKKVHVFKKEIQKFILQNRDIFQDPDRKSTGHNLEAGERGALTFHGLRHSYSRLEFEHLQNEGLSEDKARKKLAEYLGHGRPRIVQTYLGGK